MLGYQMLRQVVINISARILGARLGDKAMPPHAQSAPVEQDRERFKLLFTNSRPKMQAGYKAAVAIRTTRELIRERLEANTACARNS
jgi:hypothetical protein